MVGTARKPFEVNMRALAVSLVITGLLAACTDSNQDQKVSERYCPTSDIRDCCSATRARLWISPEPGAMKELDCGYDDSPANRYTVMITPHHSGTTCVMRPVDECTIPDFRIDTNSIEVGEQGSIIFYEQRLVGESTKRVRWFCAPPGFENG